MIFFLLLGVLLGGLSVIFVLQNVVPITVTFLTWQIEGSLAIVLLLALLSGVIITLLLLLPSLIRDEYRYAELKRQKKVIEDELTATRRVIDNVAARPTVVEPVVPPPAL